MQVQISSFYKSTQERIIRKVRQNKNTMISHSLVLQSYCESIVLRRECSTEIYDLLTECLLADSVVKILGCLQRGVNDMDFVGLDL